MFKKVVYYKYNEKGRKTYLPCTTTYYCRFCNTQKKRSDFGKDAHVVSESLGNKYLLSKYECDQCNLDFANCEENEIGKLFKFYKANRGLKGKKGKTKIKKDGIEMMADYIEESKNYSFHLNTFGSSYITRYDNGCDQRGKVFTLKLRDSNIIDFRCVYRALLKYAWGIIPENLIDDLERSFILLHNDDGKQDLRLCAFIHEKINRNYEIALYKDNEWIYTRYICLIDIFQFTYVIFLNCEPILSSELYKYLHYDSDDILKVIDLDYSSSSCNLLQEDEIKGIVSDYE